LLCTRVGIDAFRQGSEASRPSMFGFHDSMTGPLLGAEPPRERPHHTASESSLIRMSGSLLQEFAQAMPNRSYWLKSTCFGTPHLGNFLSFQPQEVSRVHRALYFCWRATKLKLDEGGHERKSLASRRARSQTVRRRRGHRPRLLRRNKASTWEFMAKPDL